jgi:Heterokaryon incompatibility protein (HET)
MADIYNQASSVRVWLGEAGEDSNLALNFIRRVLNLSQLDQLVHDELSPDGWAAVLNLMKRPWFSRRWIVQEIALARKAYLHCGDEFVTWKELAEAVSLFTNKHHDVRKLFQGSAVFDHHPDFLGEIEELGANRLVYAASNLFRKSDDGTIMEHLLSLEALMSSLTVFEASNPHDIVYAILWLANDATPSTEARASSLNEHSVLHTPAGGSPVAGNESPPPITFPLADRRASRTSIESATNNSSRNEHSEGQPPVDHTNAYLMTRAHSLQGLLAVPLDSQKGHKRTGSDLSQPPPRFRLKVKPAVDRKITVDYRKTVYEVCKDFLEFALTQSESLDIICRPWAPSPPEGEADLPSWIPKLSGAPFELVDKVYKRVEADPLVGLPGIGRKNYNASGKRKAIWRIKEDVGRSLFVWGFVLDTVKVKSETARQGTIPAEWLEVVQWQKDKEATAPDRFWRTLVADRGPDGSRPPTTYQSGFTYAFQRKGQRGDLNTREMTLFGKCPTIAIDFLRRVQAVVWKRSLILTSRGNFLGLAPSKTREGDLICILYGCSVPIVLRKVDRIVPAANKSDHYHQFIGECYIHGMMDGEAVRHQKEKGPHQQEFELR